MLRACTRPSAACPCKHHACAWRPMHASACKHAHARTPHLELTLLWRGCAHHQTCAVAEQGTLAALPARLCSFSTSLTLLPTPPCAQLLLFSLQVITDLTSHHHTSKTNRHTVRHGHPTVCVHHNTNIVRQCCTSALKQIDFMSVQHNSQVQGLCFPGLRFIPRS